MTIKSHEAGHAPSGAPQAQIVHPDEKKSGGVERRGKIKGDVIFHNVSRGYDLVVDFRLSLRSSGAKSGLLHLFARGIRG